MQDQTPEEQIQDLQDRVTQLEGFNNDIQSYATMPIALQNAMSERLGTGSFLTTAGLNGFQIYTANDTFNVPGGFTNFMVQALGGGANGAGLSGNGQASGGSAGTYCESFVTLNAGASITVTIGAAGGNDTSFGTYVVAPGGGSATSAVGTLQIPGQTGDGGQILGSIVMSGKGGSSILGWGGTAVFAGSGAKNNGISGQGYGSGGSGSASQIGSSSTGGAGTGGIIIISW